MIGRPLRAALLAAFAALAPAVLAQEMEELNPFRWSISAQPPAVSTDRKIFSVELRARIDNGWHLYSTEKVEGGPSPTRITLLPSPDLELAGELDAPAAHSAYDPNFQIATEYYEGEVTFRMPIKSTASATKVRVQVRYQTCTATLCLPPKLIELEALLNGDEKNSPSPRPAENVSTSKSAVTATTIADFEFYDFQGDRRHFSEFRGKVVLLDFWASWCSPCLADIPQLKAAYQKYHAEGFEIIGMNSETLAQKNLDDEFAKDAELKAREIVSTRGISWPQATPASSLPVAATFGIENLPVKILLDRRGRVIARLKNVSELNELLPTVLHTGP